jgi:hypothetical protein
MRIRLSVVVLLVFACAGSAAATWSISKDTPFDGAEMLLSGVSVAGAGDSIGLLIVKFGKPTQTTDRPDTPYQHGQRDYEWDLGTIRLRVTTVKELGFTFFPDEIVETVEIWGPKALGQIGTTGRGLQLGATVSDVGRIYGSRFGHEPRPSRIKTLAIAEPITITWSTSALEIYLGTNGRVNHIKLTRLDPWRDF